MQLKYGEMDVALVGQIADLSNKTIDSFAAEEALDPGVPVIRGSNPEKQIKKAGTGTLKDVIGITVHQHKEPDDPYYPVGYSVGVMTRGRIWVPVTKAVTAGKVANYKIADNGFTDEDVASGIEAVGVSCVFLTSSAAAGIAEIEIGHANVTVTAGA